MYLSVTRNSEIAKSLIIKAEDRSSGGPRSERPAPRTAYLARVQGSLNSRSGGGNEEIFGDMFALLLCASAGGMCESQASILRTERPFEAREMEKRGDQGMGFSQDKVTHHFLLRNDGGAIQVTANSSTDKDQHGRNSDAPAPHRAGLPVRRLQHSHVRP